MKKILLFFFLCFSLQSLAQTNWINSSKINVTAYGSIDTVGNGLPPNLIEPWDSSFIRQPMKTSFIVVNDTLYLIDSLKNEITPTAFYSKLIGNDSVQIALDTIPSISDPKAYQDEDFTNFWGILFLQQKEIRLELGHINSVQTNIRYKSIWYNIKTIGNNQIKVTPEWQRNHLLPDTILPVPSSNDFFILVHDSTLVFYHAAHVSSIGYNLNTTALINDTMYCELYPSKVMVIVVPLKPEKKRAQFWSSPRFNVLPLSALNDTIHVGYYYERAGFDRKQFFEWIEIVKTGSGNITYSHNVQPNALLYLPIQELKLTVTPNKKANTINWRTRGEENVDYFEIQKSRNGYTFQSIYKEMAKGGQEEMNYSYTDHAPFNVSYYRIKAVDADQQHIYSNTVIVRTPKSSEITISPNPSNGFVNIQGIQDEAYKLKLIALDGSVLLDKLIDEKKNKYKIDLRKFPRGIYMLHLRNLENDQSIIEKIIKH